MNVRAKPVRYRAHAMTAREQRSMRNPRDWILKRLFLSVHTLYFKIIAFSSPKYDIGILVDIVFQFCICFEAACL